MQNAWHSARYLKDVSLIVLVQRHFFSVKNANNTEKLKVKFLCGNTITGVYG